jgi:hypothetical protein
MSTLVQTAAGEVPFRASGFGVVLLWSLIGITLSLAAAHFGFDFSTLS